MLIALRILGACGLAFLAATPIAHTDAVAAADVETAPSSAVVALRTAAFATTSDLTSRSADLPGRAHLGGLRLGASARTGLVRVLPDEVLHPLRSARDTMSVWRANTRQVVHVASTMHRWISRAGGVRAATGFAFDAAAAGAVGIFALVWALRTLNRRWAHGAWPSGRGGGG